MSSPTENPLRTLIREIHRRSLWQVLGIYLAGSWVAYEVVQGLTEGLGLPTWLPGVALVLLIIGLPVVMATAFVQEGGPAVSSADSVADLEDILSGDGSPDEEASTLHRLFNWRNALLGGAAAFVLLTTVALTWMSVARDDLSASLQTVFDEIERDSSIDPSVAVMPCDDLSPSGDQAALAQGIADEVSMALSQLPDLKVSGRSSVLAMQAQDAELSTISNTLDVANVLQCTLVRDGNSVRVNTVLTEAETGSVLWSGQFNEEFTDLFELLDSVAQGISRELRIAMVGQGDGTLVSEGTTVPEAHEAYLRGRYAWTQRTPESLRAAVEEFRQAIELDSTYAQAWSGLADALYVLGIEESERAMRDEGLHAAQNAVELAPDLGMAHTSLGFGRLLGGDWEEARSAFERALSLNPGYATAHQWYAVYLGAVGRENERLRQVERAFRLDPVSAAISHELAVALRSLGRLQDATDQWHRLTSLHPNVFRGWYGLSEVLLQRGQYEEGLESWLRAAELAGVEDLSAARRVYQAMIRYHRSGQPTNISLPFASWPAFVRVSVYAQTGQTERAVEAFEELIGDGLVFFAATAHHRWSEDALGDHPRYQALLDEAGITW